MQQTSYTSGRGKQARSKLPGERYYIQWSKGDDAVYWESYHAAESLFEKKKHGGQSGQIVVVSARTADLSPSTLCTIYYQRSPAGVFDIAVCRLTILMMCFAG